MGNGGGIENMGINGIGGGLSRMEGKQERHSGIIQELVLLAE